MALNCEISRSITIFKALFAHQPSCNCTSTLWPKLFASSNCWYTSNTASASRGIKSLKVIDRVLNSLRVAATACVNKRRCSALSGSFFSSIDLKSSLGSTTKAWPIPIPGALETPLSTEVWCDDSSWRKSSFISACASCEASCAERVIKNDSSSWLKTRAIFCCTTITPNTFF